MVTATETDEVQDAVARIATYQRMAIAAVVLAGAALAFAAIALSRSLHVEVPTGPPALDASELVIRDVDGSVRGRWSPTGIAIADPSGRMRAGVSLGNEGAPNLTLFSKNGGVRAVVGLGADDTPGITLHDASSRVRTRIIVGDGDTPSVTVTDPQGNVVARVPAAAPTPAPKARPSKPKASPVKPKASPRKRR